MKFSVCTIMPDIANFFINQDEYSCRVGQQYRVNCPCKAPPMLEGRGGGSETIIKVNCNQLIIQSIS